MLVFLDDSGDPGFRFGHGSSTHFVLALVGFATEADARQATERIQALRLALRFPDTEEFKFHRSRREVRERFLRTVAPCPFEVRSLVIDKTALHAPDARQGKEAFYRFAIRQLLARHREILTDARVRIDGSGERLFRRHVQRELRGTVPVRNVRLVRSHGEVLIQMADMVAGAIRRSYDPERADRGLYKALIAHRIADEWLWQA